MRFCISNLERRQGKSNWGNYQVFQENLLGGNYKDTRPCFKAYWINSALVLMLSCSIMRYL